MDALVKGIDTTILLTALDLQAAQRKRAVEVLEQSIRGLWAACVCDASIFELCDILTDPKRVARIWNAEQIEKLVDRLTKHPQPQVLYADEAVAKRALRLIQKYPVLSGKFMQAQIAATLLEHGVKTIVTADSATYLTIRELNVENPFEALFV